ncbi:MAG: dockerin type I domain-containing protein [Planctomycetaceae bacterium]|nr:dockerin type I domain-containing protein [Planctomycetaceae bacterium]
MKSFVKKTCLAALILAVGALTNQLYAQQHQVNISGATLFADFFSAPASTNDYIDADGDGLYGSLEYAPWTDQLATTYSTSGWSSYWSVAYRGVGSGSGLTDLVNWYNRDPELFTDLTVPADFGYINRIEWAKAGVMKPIADPYLPGGCPVDPCNIDIAVMDVPTTWFVYTGADTDAQWNKKPAQTGYGRNPVKCWNTTQSNKLKSLGALNTNTTSPNAQTVFDTEIAWVPIAIIANQGVGLPSGNISAEQLQYLNVTGRMPSGENLAAVTRDSGSGTRNGAMNTLGVDPSWGRGDNIGTKFDAEAETMLGKTHKYTNCGGSGTLEKAVETRRLAVGYTGLCGTSRARGDVYSGRYEVCSVKNIGGTTYIRPTLDNILDNGNADSGWRIGGNETFATVGDPNQDATYAMANPHAAAYINNITKSIADFVDSTELSLNYNMPGEYMAYNYFLVASIDAMPTSADPTVFAANAKLNQSLQDFVRASDHELKTLPIPAYGSMKLSGIAPNRTGLSGSATYSDGRTSSYIDNGENGGNEVVGGSTSLSERNKVSGDFNYAGTEKHKRNVNDIAKLVEAVKNPRAFEAGVNHGGYYGTQAGDYVVPEIIGDFDGDGNFVAADIRYFADGLAIDAVTGNLDRSKGFTLVDQSDKATGGNGNYFNTALATGLAYEPNSGWSKADIAGKEISSTDHNNVKVTPGANPVAADGVINAKDIDWICTVLRGGIKAAALGQTPSVNSDVHSNVLNWNNLDDASWMDLNCDMNGDLIVDGEDLDIVVIDILGTNYGDVNLDGEINAADRDIIVANISTSYGKSWADGDINGDGYVTADDLAMYRNIQLEVFASYWLETCSSPDWCEGMDYNHSGRVNFVDFATLAQNL